MMCHQQTSSSSCAHLMYDQHSSEEELEVINGPSSQAGQHPGGTTTAATGSSSCTSRISNRGCTSSLDTEAPYEERATTSNSKRSTSSTLMVENRKRSLAHSSDDEVAPLMELHPLCPLLIQYLYPYFRVASQLAGAYIDAREFSYIAAIGGIQAKS